jgi:hypothetical protein
MLRQICQAGTVALCLGGAAVPADARTVSVTVSPPSASLQPNDTKQFTAEVTGTANRTVAWLVNGIRGGAPSIGTISIGGLYTAPADLAAPLAVTVEAASVAAPEMSGGAGVRVAASSKAGPRFYVATTGDNSNPGTAAAPWRTIQHAVATAPAGATILVHGGTYNELVTITRSGSATQGFTSLEAVGGETPAVDGTGLGIPNGQNGLFTIDGASYVRIDGFEIRNYVSKSAARVPIGIYVEGAGNHIELRNNHIHDITTTVTTSAGDALGIAVYGSEAPTPISQLIVDGNELDHLITGFSESLSLSGNVTLWQVTNNVIHDNDNIGINIEGFFQTAPRAAVDFARNGLVAANTVYNITSKHNPAYDDTLGADGIYVDGGAFVTIQQNLVHHTDIGIELASEVPGRATNAVIAHDNLIYRNFVTGFSIGGADRTANGGTTNCTIANNTLFDDDSTLSGSGEFQIQFHAIGNVFDNNILFANAQGLLVDSFVAGATVPAALDHNLYFSSAGDDDSDWIWFGKTYVGFAAFRAGTENDPHGRYGNPRFLNIATPDLRTASTSPAIDAGLDLGVMSVGLVDFGNDPRTRGTTIDAGAFER